MTDVRPETAGEAAALAYTYKPSLLGGACAFRLAVDGFDWSVGSRSGHVPFRNVRRLHMSFRPASMQTHRFVTEIWAEGAPKIEIVSTSWKSLVEQERLGKPYSAFVAELHRRIAREGQPVQCTKGRNPIVYWPGVAVFFGVAIGLAVLVVRALEARSLGGAAFIGAFLALFVWHGGNFFRRNRPGAYRVEAPPPELLPKE